MVAFLAYVYCLPTPDTTVTQVQVQQVPTTRPTTSASIQKIPITGHVSSPVPIISSTVAASSSPATLQRVVRKLNDNPDNKDSKETLEGSNSFGFGYYGGYPYGGYSYGGYPYGYGGSYYYPSYYYEYPYYSSYGSSYYQPYYSSYWY